MSKRQLAVLFSMYALMSILGVGLLPLLPVYATRLGAPPAVVGYYMAFIFAAVAAGAFSAGWIFERLGRPRLPLFCCGALNAPLVVLMGRVTSVWPFAALNAMLFFIAGIGGTLVFVLAGLSAGPDERGQVFGVLAAGNGLGALIAGLTAGIIADRWGYATMLAAGSLTMLLWALTALLVQPAASTGDRREVAPAQKARAGMTLGFWLLCAAAVVTSLAGTIGGLGRSLGMDALGLSASAISGTTILQGIISMPLPLLVGWLSDRLGRRWLLVASYLASMAALLMLTRAATLWQFLLAWAVMALSGNATPLGSALTADLVPKALFARAMALFSAIGWLGPIVGYAGAGNVIQVFGLAPSLMVGAGLTVVGMLLVAAIRRPAPPGDPKGLPRPLGSGRPPRA